jgi:membrane-associated protease RseP (regulator of RpoE activity)
VDAEALARPIGEGPAPAPRSRPLGIRARLAAGVAQERAGTANVLGFLPGRDPALAAECVVVGAHFDHLGLGGEASLAPDQLGVVHPGADDNASGTAAMLQIARAMLREPEGPRRTVLFAAFSAEELGLLGSSHLVRSPPAACPVERMQLMVNLDMVGRPSKGKVYVDGGSTARGLRDRVAALARRGPPGRIEVAPGAGDGYGPSDHTSFYARGVPVLFFFTGAHADYHRPSDTADKIDAEGLAEVARLAWRVADDAARRPDRLEAVRAPPPPGSGGPTGDRPSGYGAYLGSVPDFEERTEPGVLLSGVRAGSPAEKAGLRAGDVILELGGRRIMNLQDLTYALRSHRAGDEVEVVFSREGRSLRAKATLGERR